MELLQVAAKIKTKFPKEVLSVTESRGQVSITIEKESLLNICRHLHNEPELDFDYLQDLCGMDYLSMKKDRFQVVYQLYSIGHRHRIRLKAPVPEDDCSIESVTPIWTGANWHERECYDMFGIVFKNHPDLRRILMPEDWEGHPLRKDYPLAGPPLEQDWKGFKEVLDKSKNLKEYEWLK